MQIAALEFGSPHTRQSTTWSKKMMLQISMNLKAKTEFKELFEWFGSYLTTCDEQRAIFQEYMT
jgi:hypothetical protein